MYKKVVVSISILLNIYSVSLAQTQEQSPTQTYQQNLSVDQNLDDLLTKLEHSYTHSDLESYLQLNGEQKQEIIALENKYLQSLDHAIKEKMLEYVEQSYQIALTEAKQLKKQKQWTSLQFRYFKNNLERKKAKFIKTQIFFGTAKDFQRFNSFREYNKAVQEVLKEDQAKWNFFKGLKNLISQIQRGLQLLLPFTKLSYYTLFPRLDDSRGTPLTKAADEFFHKQKELDNVKIQISGREHLESDLKNKEINIILSNHVNADNDAMVLSELKLKDYITFGALNLKGEGIFSIATHPAFSFVLNRIDQQRDIILLGRGINPIEKLIDILSSGRTSNLFLFPQGMISLGFNESNPLKPSFSEKVILPLIEAGFKVNLHLMSMPDNFVSSSHEKTKSLRAFIEKPLNNEDIKKIITEQGPESMDRIIRMQWIKRIRQFDKDYLGLIAKDQDLLNSFRAKQCLRSY